MVRSLARWLVAAAGSVLLGLALIGAGLYWHFLRSGPAPAAWHEVRLADFTAGQADAVRTLDDRAAVLDGTPWVRGMSWEQVRALATYMVDARAEPGALLVEVDPRDNKHDRLYREFVERK